MLDTEFIPRLYAPHVPPVYIPINRAGSVGKTTYGWNACVQAALKGKRGLYIDADLQSDASFYSGYDGDQLPPNVVTVHDVMLGRHTLKEAMVPARTRIAPGDKDESFKTIPNLYLVRGDEKMSAADTELAQDNKGVFWLQVALAKQIEEGEFDFIWIDPPASLGTLTISLLLAATEVICCIKPGRKELRGATALIRRVEEIRTEYEYFNANPHVRWVFINEGKRAESQGKFYLKRQNEAREVYGDRVLPMLTSSTAVAESLDAQEPLAFWVPDSQHRLAIDASLVQMGLVEKEENAA
ncbi:AAA family ATPase [Streptomyces bobili]|uniref:ParA family protein n=1 Tax=Streptomyces bobili TaxID=67280 RepID=UPI003448CDF2